MRRIRIGATESGIESGFMKSDSGDSRSRISLLLISYFYPPVVGGAEIHGQRLAAELVRQGHEVTVLCSGGGPMPSAEQWFDPYGVRIRSFGSRWSPRWRGRALAAGVIWTLVRDRNKYQLAHYLLGGLQVLLGVPLGRFLGKPSLVMFGGSDDLRGLIECALGRLELWVIKRWADRIIVLNPLMIEEIAAVGVAAAKIISLPCEVDPSEFSPCTEDRRLMLRRELGLPVDADVIVFTGRFVPSKSLPALIAAFARVVERRPTAMLCLVGDGSERDDIVRRVSAAGLEARVRFTGMLDSRGVREWLQASDVFALVSSTEGIPCSLVEAMAVGLPAVVTDIPAMSQLIDDHVHGVRVPVGDEAAIVQGLVGLLENPLVRSRLGEAARSRVAAEFSVEQVARKYVNLYRELICE
jgi:glycosyltransferase involved in cell wall biosynthesis